jgi:hypothetical protein
MHLHSSEGDRPVSEEDKPDSAPEEGQDESGDDRECAGDEFVIPGPPLPDGGRLCLRHSADHSVRQGVMRPLESGKPLSEDAILLEPRAGTPLFDVVGSVADMRKGPSKVVTNAYRKGWDAVFGGKPDPKAN